MAKILVNQLPKKDEPQVPEIPASEVSIDGLIDNGLLALYREMKNLLMASAKGKLDSASSRDLRDTIKLLFELKDREQDLLGGITAEELEKKLKEMQENGNN